LTATFFAAGFFAAFFAGLAFFADAISTSLSDES
jgi:hypothetical protein